jgi:hypothetical protein
MDKKELYKEVEDLDKFCIGIRKYVALNEVMYLIKQLDDPQKVTIPQIVADWLKYCKNTFLSLARALAVSEEDFYNYPNQKDHLDLLYFLASTVNQETFAKAWLFGYEVEKEKKYFVKLKNTYTGLEYLKYDLVVKKWYFGMNHGSSTARLSHTKDELTEGDFDWVFSCEGVEVKEVEE